MLPIWIASIILLIGIYSGKQSPSERERAVADVQKCITAMKEMEILWRQAGKLTDVMTEFTRELLDPPSHPVQQQLQQPASAPLFDPATLEPMTFDLSPFIQLNEEEDLWSQLFAGYM
jgi:hypothetical protein